MDPDTTPEAEASATPSTTVQAADTDPPVEDQTYVPPLLLFVFGAPVFLTLIWFFLRFTAPDRFGRVDRSRLPDPPDPDEHDVPDDTDEEPDTR